MVGLVLHSYSSHTARTLICTNQTTTVWNIKCWCWNIMRYCQRRRLGGRQRILPGAKLNWILLPDLLYSSCPKKAIEKHKAGSTLYWTQWFNAIFLLLFHTKVCFYSIMFYPLFSCPGKYKLIRFDRNTWEKRNEPAQGKRVTSCNASGKALLWKRLSPSLTLGKVFLSFNSQIVLLENSKVSRFFGNNSFIKMNSPVNLKRVWFGPLKSYWFFQTWSRVSADAHRHQVPFGILFQAGWFLAYSPLELWFITTPL